MFDVLELHRRLAAAARPSGTEATGIAQVLRELAAPFVDEITTDAMGNLICHRKGSGPRVMLAAHMDAVGFIVTGVSEEGYLSIHKIGWHDPARVIGHRIVFPDGTRGVICLRNSEDALDEKWSAISFDKLFADIGAKNREEALQHVSVGSMAAFEGLPEAIGGHRIMGPYADDLTGCMVLLLALEQMKQTDKDVYAVFSTQEEVGTRGAKAAALAIRPQIAIACDVCNTDDTPAAAGREPVVLAGKGPTVKIMDNGTLCNPALNAALKAAAARIGIHCQDEIMIGGGTDTAPMQQSTPDVAATCISIPARYIHSPAEIYDRRDVEQAGALLAAYLSE